ncbi:hypothetical protein ACFXDH_51305 [Streptomyces sp. NPDC059467]|uniref:hypothetical protein n=1 Tax=Streptomyces sp. NPDC059467 TaxID=3346844 RepID=UPI0036C16B2B
MTTDPPSAPSTPPPEELWTVSVVADYLGFTGESATGSARRQLSRWGIAARSREPGRSGQSLYPAAQVRAAHEARPGRGRHGASRTEGGRFTASTDT